ncbi:hypothetical protein QBC35DRAFT_477150 [Podospora australis]|uniref:Uncharacterized protein n=1 Tax=Podospora australis TaxID=1536484 RepID=A0AAN6WMC0_9PEZI|nr:hypothetical protein QBC35DRAFT_477150 [Podospora australis]
MCHLFINTTCQTCGRVEKKIFKRKRCNAPTPAWGSGVSQIQQHSMETREKTTEKCQKCLDEELADYSPVVEGPDATAKEDVKNKGKEVAGASNDSRDTMSAPAASAYIIQAL